MADSTVTAVPVKTVAPAEIKKADATKVAAPEAGKVAAAPVATAPVAPVAAPKAGSVAEATPTKDQGKKLYMMA